MLYGILIENEEDLYMLVLFHIGEMDFFLRAATMMRFVPAK